MLKKSAEPEPEQESVDFTDYRPTLLAFAALGLKVNAFHANTSPGFDEQSRKHIQQCFT